MDSVYFFVFSAFERHHAEQSVRKNPPIDRNNSESNILAFEWFT